MELVMPFSGEMNVEVYNLLGQSIATLANGYMDAGTYNLTWDASNAASGMYLLRAEYDGNVSMQKLMFLK